MAYPIEAILMTLSHLQGPTASLSNLNYHTADKHSVYGPFAVAKLLFISVVRIISQYEPLISQDSCTEQVQVDS